jgi:hypothetical protein
MFAQIGNWIELNFWQLAVQALSKARPLSAQVLRAANGFEKLSKGKQLSFEARPLPRAFRNGWIIAGSGWLLGLILGFLFAIR